METNTWGLLKPRLKMLVIAIAIAILMQSLKAGAALSLAEDQHALEHIYLQDEIGPRVGERLQALASLYWKELSNEERLIAWHLGAQPGGYLTPESDWAAFKETLDACQTKEDLSAFLHGEFLRINQGPDEGTRRSAFEKHARAALDAIGTGHYMDLSFMYQGFTDDYAYDVYAAEMDPEEPRPKSYVRFTLSVDGRITDVYSVGGRFFTDAEPITEDQRTFVGETALHLANTCATIDAGDLDTVVVSDKIYLRDTDDAAFAMAWVSYELGPYGWDEETGETVNMRLGLVMSIDVRSGRVYEMYHAGESAFESVFQEMQGFA